MLGKLPSLVHGFIKDWALCQGKSIEGAPLPYTALRCEVFAVCLCMCVYMSARVRCSVSTSI